MKDDMKKFLEMLSADSELQSNLQENLKNNNKQLIIDFAASKGLQISMDDLDRTTAESCELDDDELDAIVGGQAVSCACAVGGGGSGDENDKTCACVLGGAGYTYDGRDRCFCALGGGGYDY